MTASLALGTLAASTTATLRVATAGSVDDGKSTLIGRLLHDTKTILEDQWRAVERASRRWGGELNLALLTDGLRAEREQGITIDVAHRYFATPRRSFIVADSPGHAQYTRNMVTAASTADVAVVLVDARHGVTEQTRRHAFIAALVGVEHIVLAVNKMDLVDWDERRFDAVAGELADYLRMLPTSPPLTAVPVSALHGDNVVERSDAHALVRRPAAPGAARARRAGARVRRRRRAVGRAVVHPPPTDRLPWCRRPAERRTAGRRRRRDDRTVRRDDPRPGVGPRRPAGAERRTGSGDHGGLHRSRRRGHAATSSSAPPVRRRGRRRRSMPTCAG